MKTSYRFWMAMIFLVCFTYFSGIGAITDEIKYIPADTSLFLRIENAASINKLGVSVGQKIGQTALPQLMTQFLGNLLSTATPFKDWSAWSSQGLDPDGSIIIWGKPPLSPLLSFPVKNADQVKRTLMENQAYTSKSHGSVTYYRSDASAWIMTDDRLIYATEAGLLQSLDACANGSTLKNHDGFNRLMINATNQQVITYWNLELLKPLITASLNQLPPPIYTHPVVQFISNFLFQIKSAGVTADFTMDGMQLNLITDLKDSSWIKDLPHLSSRLDGVPEKVGLAVDLHPAAIKTFSDKLLSHLTHDISPLTQDQIAHAINDLTLFVGQSGVISVQFPNGSIPSLNFVCEIKDQAGAERFLHKYFSVKLPLETLFGGLNLAEAAENLVPLSTVKNESHEGIKMQQIPLGFRLPPLLQQLVSQNPMVMVVRDENAEQSKYVKKLVEAGWKGSWSPDGRRIVYGKPDSQGLCIVDVETGKSQEFYGYGKDPVWSPDGGNIAFAHAPSGTDDYQAEEIYVIPATGGTARKIALGGFPGWSGDGKTLYYHSRVEGKIFAVQIDNTDAKPEMFFDKPASWYPVVSPDGTKIAAGNNGTLSIVDRATSEVLAQWTAPGLRGVLPSWSWDGKQVAFGGFNDDPGGIWIYDVENRKPNNIIKGAYTMPAFSKEGKMVFDFRSGNVRELWVRELGAPDSNQESTEPMIKMCYAFHAGKLAISLGTDTSGLKASLDCIRGAKPTFAKTPGFDWMRQQQLTNASAYIWFCPITLLQWENSLRRSIADEMMSNYQPGVAASMAFGATDGAFVQRLCISWIEVQKISNLAKTVANAFAPTRDTYSEFEKMREAGQWDEMYQMAEEEIQAAPGSAEMVVNNLINVAQQGSHMRHLIKHFENQLKKNTNNVVALGVLGLVNLNNGLSKKALEYSEKAVQLVPDNIALLMVNAQAHRQNGHDTKAIALYQKIIDMDPNRANAYMELAGIYGSLGKNEQVLSLAEKASPHLQNASHQLMVLGDIYIQGKYYTNAIAVYQKAIDKDPHLYWYQDKLAIAYEMAGEVDKAEAIYDSMTDPNYIMQRFYRISSQGDLAKIKNVALRIIESPKSQYWQVNNAMHQLIEAFARQNLANQLEPLVKKYYEEKPEDIQRVYQLGRLYEKMKNYSKSAALYEKRLEKLPKEPGLLSNLSAAYSQLGRNDEAIRIAKRTIEYFPHENTFYIHLATLYSKNQHTNEIAQLAKEFDKEVINNPEGVDKKSATQQLSKIYFLARQYEVALTNIAKIMKNQESDDYELIDHWIKAHIRIGKAKELEAQALNSDNPEFILRVLSEYSQAEKLAQDQLEQLWKMALHFWKGAEQPYQKFQGLNQLKDAYRKQNCIELLEAKIQQEIDRNPKDAFMHGLMGAIYQDKKQYAQSVESYQKAMEYSENPSEYQHNLIAAYMNNKQFEKAISQIQPILTRNSEQIDLYPQLALAYAELGQKSEANQTLGKLKQILKQTHIQYSSDYRNSVLADACTAAEQYDEAIDLYKKSIELEPANARLYKEKLMKAYSKAGKTQLAEELRKTLDKEKKTN